MCVLGQARVYKALSMGFVLNLESYVLQCEALGLECHEDKHIRATRNQRLHMHV